MAKMTDKQRSAIMHGKGNILVSASAGSGKTHTMIERVKRLVLEEDVGIDKILAVTFTEAAATDMKEKLKKALSNKQGADAKKTFASTFTYSYG